nr:MAG TPA: hypothetical protein [Caudoviricetes sp.]
MLLPLSVYDTESMATLSFSRLSVISLFAVFSVAGAFNSYSRWRPGLSQLYYNVIATFHYRTI